MAFFKFIPLALLLFIGFASTQQVSDDGDDDKPYLRIVAPQYICDSKDKSNKTDSNKLTIGLQTREGQRLKYAIAIDFTILEGFKNQRHTLSIWRNVRELQKKFQAKEVADEISMRNQIEIDALELTPQVVYTFKIIGYDEKKRASEEQNFTITYKGDKLEAVNSNVGDGVSLLLYGPETFYNDLELLAVAEVMFCDAVNDYFYQWTVKGMSKEDQSDYLGIKGSTLRLPGGLLSADKFYEVSVTIFNNKSQAMASLSLPIKVFSKEFKVQNVPAECSIGVNREAPYEVSLYRSSIVNDIDFKWSCSEGCDNAITNGSGTNQVAAAFMSEGTFELKSQVNIKSVTKESKTKITTDPKIIPHVEVKYFPQLPINTKQVNEFSSTLIDLVPKCTAAWKIESDGDFAKPKAENLAELGVIAIKDYEEHFLKEIADYDNNTLSKDITLTIPDDALFPDVKYKFRLNVNCPEPLTDLTTPTDRKNVPMFYDIVVETNGSPEPLPLDVSPLVGIPMSEKFTFKTGAAKDQQSDYPLKYTFGYIINNMTIIIGTFYEYQVATTQLPYSDQIHTFFEVSDNNNASIHVKGPTVMANVSYKFSKSEIDFKLSEIEGMLKRAEYSKSLNSAFTLLLTQRKYATPENAKLYEEKLYEMLKTELDSLKSSKSSTFVYQQNVIEFVKMSENLISIMTVYDETFIENVLSLTEASGRTKRMTLSNGLRNREIMTPDPEYINNVLRLSDYLLSSPNTEVAQRERRKYVDKIHKFVNTLCHTQNLNSHTIESKFVIFEVAKINSRQLFDKPQKFARESTNIVFSSNAAFPAKFLCIGKIRYMLDMFDVTRKESNPIYETRILDDNGKNEKVLVQSKNIGEYVIMEISSKGDVKELSCSIWLDEKWSSKSCEKLKLNTTSKIACKCKTPMNSVIVKYEKSTNVEGELNAATTEMPTALTPKFGDLSTPYSSQVTTQSSSPVQTTDSSGNGNQKDTTTEAPNKDSSEQGVDKSNSTNSSSENGSNESSDTNKSSIKPTEASADGKGGASTQSSTESAITESSTTTEVGNVSTTAFTPTTVTDSGNLPTAIEIPEITTEATTTVNINPDANKESSQEAPDEDTNKSEAAQNVTSESMKMNKTSSGGKGATTSKASDKDKAMKKGGNETSDGDTLATNRGSVNWVVVFLLCLFFLIIVVLILLHRCRRLTENFINLPMRQPSNDIKYAKYHDEFIMRG